MQQAEGEDCWRHRLMMINGFLHGCDVAAEMFTSAMLRHAARTLIVANGQLMIDLLPTVIWWSGAIVQQILLRPPVAGCMR
jgi:hypothetical protein